MTSLKVGSGKRAEALAKVFGASRAYVEQARALLQDAPKAAASVKAGRVSLTAAYEALKAAQAQRENAEQQTLDLERELLEPLARRRVCRRQVKASPAVSAAERIWIKGIGYGVPDTPKPERVSAPAAPVEREPTPEPVEDLTPEQVAAKCRATMTRVLASLDELRPHTYGRETAEDIRWLRRRAQQIHREV